MDCIGSNISDHNPCNREDDGIEVKLECDENLATSGRL